MLLRRRPGTSKVKEQRVMVVVAPVYYFQYGRTIDADRKIINDS